MFDAMKVKDDCVKWIRAFFDENGKDCNAIVGISGGKAVLLSPPYVSKHLAEIE